MHRARKEKEIMNFTFYWILTETMKLAEIKYHKKARNVFTFEKHLLDCQFLYDTGHSTYVESIL